MSIRRNPERGRYTIIGNDAIEDRGLSFGALGLLCYVLSKPDNWIIRTADVMARGGIGRGAYTRMMDELSSAGYATLVRTKGPGGKATGSYWDVSEVPTVGASEAQENGVSENPTSGKPDSLVSTDLVVMPEEAVKTETTDAPAAEQDTAETADATKRTRKPGPWDDFRATVLESYGQANDKGNQALATKIINTAKANGLDDPERAGRAWSRWRRETTADNTARYFPLHLAAEGFGAWCKAMRDRHGGGS